MHSTVTVIAVDQNLHAELKEKSNLRVSYQPTSDSGNVVFSSDMAKRLTYVYVGHAKETHVHIEPS